MTIEYIIISENENVASLEFVDSETQISTQREINIFGLTEDEKYERYESHKKAFTYRLSLNMFKLPGVEEPIPEQPPIEE